jgi:hypothetical protein
VTSSAGHGGRSTFSSTFYHWVRVFFDLLRNKPLERLIIILLIVRSGRYPISSCLAAGFAAAAAAAIVGLSLPWPGEKFSSFKIAGCWKKKHPAILKNASGYLEKRKHQLVCKVSCL